MSEKTITIDFSGCEYIGSIHKLIKEKLGFPDWYGENLEALWDMLIGYMDTNVSILLRYIPKSEKAKAIGAYVQSVIDLFKQAQTQEPNMHISIEL